MPEWYFVLFQLTVFKSASKQINCWKLIYFDWQWIYQELRQRHRLGGNKNEYIPAKVLRKNL